MITRLDKLVRLLCCCAALVLCVALGGARTGEARRGDALREGIPRPVARGTFARAHAEDVRPAEPFRLFPPDAYPQVERHKCELEHQTRSCFVLRDDRDLCMSARPRPEQALVFAVALDNPRPEGEFRLSLTAEAADQKPRVLFQWELPSGSAQAGLWRPVRVELDRYAGREVSLRFRAQVDAPEAALLLAEPRLEGAPPTERPNVVLYMIETLRRDHLSLYGYEHRTCPFLERLGREAVVFSGTHSQSSWTKPSVASYLTGLHPSQHGALTGLDRLGGPLLTLAEMLREAGYSAGGFCASPVVSSPCFNYDQGFDVFTNERMVQGEAVVADAIQWLDREKPAPFFMWVLTYDPHAPYEAPDRHREHFAAGYYGPLKEVERFARPAFRQALGGTVTSEDVDYVKARYDGEILYSDAVLADFVSALKRRGLWENTILIVCADHGEEFYEHGDWDHARDLFPEKLRVPLLIKLPAQQHAGARVDGLASAVDLVPTLLPLLGLPPDPALPGVNLLDSPCDGTAREQHFAEYWEPYYTERHGRMVTHIVAVHHSMIGPRFQYIWQQQRLPAALAEVARGRDCLWILSRGGEIWFCQGVSSDQPQARRSAHVAGRLERVAAAPGSVWGINESGGLFVRLGISREYPAGHSWHQVEGRYRSVAAGRAGVWAVDDSGRLLRRTGVTQDHPAGDGWQAAGDGCAWVSTGAGRLWVVGEDGAARCRPATAPDAADARDWTRVEGSLRRVETGPAGVVWALSEDGGLLVRNGITDDQPAGTGWAALPDCLASLAVGTECVWAVDEDGKLLVRAGVSKASPQGEEWHAVGRSTTPQESLYDLVADPKAQRDVAREYPEVLARMAELVRERYQRTGVTIAVNGTGRARTVRGRVEAEADIAEVERRRVEPDDVVVLSPDGRSLRFKLRVAADDDVLHLRTEPAAARMVVRLTGDRADSEPLYVGPRRAAHAGRTVEMDAEPGPADAEFGHAVKYATGSEGGVFIWRRLPAGQRQSTPVAPEEETMQQLRDLGYL